MHVDESVQVRDDDTAYRRRYEVYRAVFTLFRTVGDIARPWAIVRLEIAAIAKTIAALCEEDPS